MENNQGSSEVSLKEAFLYWFKLGFINFGGPAGQIAMMHKNLVDGREWTSEKVFLRALNFCGSSTRDVEISFLDSPS